MGERDDASDWKELLKGKTGIGGFDLLSQGGLPYGGLTLVRGGPGVGKTVFALQTLLTAARDEDEPGIFVAFEEPVAQIRANAIAFGWDASSLEQDNKFFLLDARPSSDIVQSGNVDFEGILTILSAKIAEIGARRIVFDSIDVLLTILPSFRDADHELRRLQEWLRREHSNMMCIITSRSDTLEQVGANHFPFMPFIADCVVELYCRVYERAAMRELRILKYRGSGFEQNEFPFAIGAQGMEVVSFGATEPPFEVSNERVSTGVSRLDSMLGGGYFRNTTVLVTGSPGTAKTTLAGCFAQAVCLRKERVLYIAFDETAGQITRNLASVNIQFAAYQDAGLLHIHALRANACSAEEHLIRIRSLIEKYAPQALVVDPLSAILRGGGWSAAQTVAERLVLLARHGGLTLLATSLPDSKTEEGSEVRISTIADVWIHLSYIATSGEHNRTLTIVKARGIGHSNQVRELVLSDEGVTLADVYTSGGAVLLGTLRAEREAEDIIANARARAEMRRRRRDLEASEASINLRVSVLQRQLEAARMELEQFEEEQRLREEFADAGLLAVRKLRQADVGKSQTDERDQAETGWEERGGGKT